jgi:YYY domain-containing protein
MALSDFDSVEDANETRSQDTDVTLQDPTIKKRFVTPTDMLVAFLLVLVVVMGGYFRFVGYNWDDFAGLHPDERFLTRNLQPILGGNNEFTPDSVHFPDHALLVSQVETNLLSRIDVSTSPDALVGALSNTTASELAVWWLGDNQRLRTYTDIGELLRALADGNVDAILLEQTEAQATINTARIVDSFSSQDMQRTRCLAMYPEQGGQGGYFDAFCSPLNPHNAGVGVYAYGTLPLFMSHFTSQFILTQELNGSAFFQFEGETLVWRALSAFFDAGSILVLFFIGTRMHNRWVGLLAALLYACAPLPIQKAHYGTVNAITNFFVTLAIYAAVSVQMRGRWWHYVLFGLALGAAVAGRINVAPLAGLVALAALVHVAPVFAKDTPWHVRNSLLTRHTLGVLVAAITSLIAFRIFNPYAFTGPSILGIIPNERWFSDLASSSYNVSGASDIPPNWQWMGRTGFLYPLKDMLLWGMGIAFGVMAWLGWVWSGYRIARNRALALQNVIPFVWTLVYFGWIGDLWVMTMRYYLPLYGALALLGAWALYELVRYARQNHHDLVVTRGLLNGFAFIMLAIPAYASLNAQALTTTDLTALVVGFLLLLMAWLPMMRGRRAWALMTFAITFTVLWGIMFTSIYRTQTTRGQASRWLWEQIPGDFAMQIEGADDSVPLINLAIQNARPESSTSPETLASSTTVYSENVPVYTEFIAPASGEVTSIFAPHLGDVSEDANEETLSITIRREGIPEPLAIATLNANLTRENHVLGDAYEIPFDTPLLVEEGQRYSVEIISLAGSIVGGGSVVLTEGDWDDRLPTIKVCSLPDGLTLADNVPPGYVGFDQCNGLSSWFALIHSYDMALSYPVDDGMKRDNIIDGLGVGDYLTITSNRFYDTLMRNPMRWPMSTEYYRLLFAGELGYELIATFDQSFELGPLSISDQHLPIYDSPEWFNEFESDEAFHVYDHPVVFIFQKSPDYNHDRVSYLLSRVSLLQISQLVAEMGELGAKVPGVIYWTSLQASQAPTALMLPDDMREAQTTATWSDRFASESPINTNQILGAISLWVVVALYGFAAYPILFRLFPTLGDRGYGFAKLVGLLLVSYGAWLLSSLRLPMWSQAGILFFLLLLFALGIAFIWRERDTFIIFLRENWQKLAWIEVITIILFVFMIGLRLTNPDLWHNFKGGEKPMNFAHMNAVLRAVTFPPADPWYAGGFINYYYWGYVLVGSPVLLLKMIPALAYNLLIPLVFALSGSAAFSLAYNIVDNLRERRKSSITDNTRTHRLGNPWAAGIAAILLCIVLGNLDTVRVLGNGLMRLGGYEPPLNLQTYLINQYEAEYGTAPSPEAMQDILNRVDANSVFDNVAYEINHGVQMWQAVFDGLGQAMGGAILPIGTDRWYWGPSRVLAEAPGVGGNAITEMPMFTFIYGDLHAHMINIPILLLVLMLVFNEVILAECDPRRMWALALSIGLLALSVGMIEAINTWDYPSFLLFSIVGLGYAWWLRHKSLSRRSIVFLLVFVGGFLMASLVFSAPYRYWYGATYNSIQPWTGGKTPLWAYFDIHGLFLFLFVSLLIWDTGRWLRSVRLYTLRGKAPWLLVITLAIAIALTVALVVTLIEYQVSLIVVPLVIWLTLLFFRTGQTRTMQYVLVLAGFAFSITLGVEFIVIGGDIARQNTVFKFYYQVWVILSVVGGVAFAWLIQHTDNWRGWLRWTWFTPLMIMTIIAAMFPIMGTRGRAYDRMVPDLPLTLNGMDFMREAQHGLLDFGSVINLNDDYEIIRWLQENVQGSPVIMEGRSLASEYRWNGRIAIYTGLPSVLGWNFHQRQQRTFDPLTMWVEQRERNVKYFYNSTDIVGSARILQAYDVGYVIVSSFETAAHAPDGIAKLGDMADMGLLETAFLRGEAQIYQVNQEALDAFLYEQFLTESQENLDDVNG